MLWSLSSRFESRVAGTYRKSNKSIVDLLVGIGSQSNVKWREATKRFQLVLQVQADLVFIGLAKECPRRQRKEREAYESQGDNGEGCGILRNAAEYKG